MAASSIKRERVYLGLAIIGLCAWVMLQAIGLASASVQTRSAGENLERARIELQEARKYAKQNPSDEAYRASLEAFDRYQDALVARIEEIRQRRLEISAQLRRLGPSQGAEAASLRQEDRALRREMRRLIAESDPSRARAIKAEMVAGGKSEAEVNDCPETANPVFGTGESGCAIISGLIATTGDVDWYRFTAAPGSKVWAYVDTPGDSLLALYTTCSQNMIVTQGDFSIAGACSSCAIQLEVDDNDGTGNGGDASIESLNASVIAGADLSAGGTYFLRVSHPTSSGTFPYQLFVVVTTGTPTPETEPNDTPATADEVFPVGATEGVVSGTGTSTDFYKVCLAAGDVLYVALDDDPLGNGGADHTLTLIDPTGMTVLFSTNSANATGDPAPPGEAFSYVITTPGTYYIQVLPITAEPNEYNLMVSRCGLGTPNCAAEGQTELTITKTDTPDPVQANNLLTYTITVTNTSQVAAANVTVTDPLPAGTVFISAAASPGSTLMTPTVGTNGTVTAIQPTLAPGATFTVTIVVRVNCSVPNGTVLSNTATVSTSTPETNPNNNSSTATTTVTNPAPVFTNCPTEPIIAVAPPACPPRSSAVVTFATPQATDANSCPGVVVSCNPPSGGIFPVGNTTVTCTATDLAGQTATCSFTVMLFNACIQDDSNPSRVIIFNTFTGDYIACCGSFKLAGKGRVTQQGCIVTLEHNTADRRVNAQIDFTQRKGNGAVQSPPGTTRCTISDKNINNNTCNCTPPPTNGGVG